MFAMDILQPEKSPSLQVQAQVLPFGTELIQRHLLECPCSASDLTRGKRGELGRVSWGCRPVHRLGRQLKLSSFEGLGLCSMWLPR